MSASSDRKGQVILITGGGSGMGRLAARNFCQQGALVAVFDVNEEGLAETAQGVEGLSTWKVDITDFAAVQAAVAELESKLGPLTGVYNAAAIMPFGKILEHNNAVQHKVMDINFGGFINITQATLPGMVARGRGDFISFASSAGLLPIMYAGVYAASKAAVAMYTEILYHENINSGVRFVCVCPAVVKTPLLQQAKDTVWPKMLDQGAPLDPQEVIDDIETVLNNGKFWVYSGKGTETGTRIRRFFPGLIWKQVHKTEGF